jgi:hypothetical protein
MYKERFEDSKWIIRGHNSNAYHKLDKEKTKIPQTNGRENTT